MAVVFVEGFDYYNGVNNTTASAVGLYSRWSTLNAGTVNSPQMVAGRFGGQAVSLLSNTGLYPVYTSLPGNYTAGTIGAAVYSATAIGTITYPIFAVGQGTSVRSSSQVFIAPNADGSIAVYRGGGTPVLLGTTAAGVLLNLNWQYIEMEYVISSTVGSVKVYVGGTNVISLTGINTQGQATNTVNAIYFEGTNGGRTYFDDVYVTDTAARLGEQRVVTSYPTSDVLTDFWTPNSGTTDYTRINETVCDGDISYVSSSTFNSRLVVEMPTLPVVPVNVNAVQIAGFARKDETQFRQLALEYQNLAGAVSTGASYTLSGGYARMQNLMAQNPLTGTAWTATDVNNMRIGARVTA